jgi:mannose-6-phosphate isomerase-like protein (cupin superfamily)
MPIIRAEAAPTFALEGTTVTGLAAPSRGSTEICSWLVRLDPGTIVPAHTLDREEVFVVLAGAAVVTLGGEQATIGAGDALVVPPTTEFSLTIPAGYSFEAVCSMAKGGQATMIGGDGTAFPPPWSV